MWQVLVAAAAAAGSGILAKKLITRIDPERPISDFTQNDQQCDQNKFFEPQDSIFHLDDAFRENSSQEKTGAFSDEGKIFRFSSPEKGYKESKQNARIGGRGLKKNGGPKKTESVEGGGKELVVDQRGNRSGKRVSVCLKKRRTGKNAAGKCDSCASKDNSFGWGVGLGIMYMMSAGNAEIGRLNSAMDETVNIVQELKAEISRRKSSHNVLENEAEMDEKYLEMSYNGALVVKSKENMKTFCPVLTEEGQGECANSVVHMEDQQPEVLEMDRLEAELELELQKLPWCATEGSGSEAEVLAKECHLEDFDNSNSPQYNGVVPAVLNRKLSDLLIERQEDQIMELEAELYHAHSKLQEKEAELQALKDCVKRLTEFSIATGSDEETEIREDVKEEEMGFESATSMVGTKRTMGYESYFCSSK